MTASSHEPTTFNSKSQPDGLESHLAFAAPPLFDFLPPRVHAETLERGDRPIHRIVIAAAVVLFLLGTLAHQKKTTGLKNQRDSLVAQQASSLEPNLAATLRKKREQLDDRANLLATFLPPVSTSRLIAIVSSSMPDHSHLTDVRVSRDSLRRGPRSTGPVAEDESDDGWRLDMEERLAASENERIQVTIEGLVREDRDLGYLIDRLSQPQVFTSIAVAYSEPAELRGLPRRQFEMRLLIDPQELVAASEQQTSRDEDRLR